MVFSWPQWTDRDSLNLGAQVLSWESRKLSEHGGTGWQSGGHYLGTQKAEGLYKEKNNVGVGVLRCSIFSFLGVFILRLALLTMWVSWPPAHRSTCLLDCWD